MRKKMKDGVLPHIFDCQPDRKRAHSLPQREAVLKRRRRELVEEAMNTEDKSRFNAPVEESDSAEPTDQALLEQQESEEEEPATREIGVQVNIELSCRSIEVQCTL